MSVPQQLLQQLLALDESVRLEIAHTLLKSVDEAVDDDMSNEERARLEAALERSLAQADAGQTVPADEVFRALRAKQAAQGGFASNDEDEDAGWTTLESLQTKIAVRDVARMTLQGAPKIELLAKYPELRDQDIDLATRIASAPLDSALYEEVDGVRFRRHPDRTPRVQISEFDKWVGEHNVPEMFEYGKGWWDYVELVRRFAARLDTEDVRVIGHYVVDTPPPRELLPMPAIALSIPGVTFALRFDFGSWSWKHDDRSEWVVSVDRRSPYRGPLFGLFDENRDLRTIGVDGLAPNFLFGSYRQDPSRFSCLLRDEWDVATLLRLMAHEV